MKSNKKKIDENPFSGLKELLVEKASAAEKVPNGSQEERGKPLSGRFSADSMVKTNETLSEDDDSSLFFSAMQSVEHMPRKDLKKNALTVTMAEVSSVLDKTLNAAITVSQKINERGEELALGKPTSSNNACKNTFAEKDTITLSERDLFTKAMNGVAPVSGKGRDIAQHGSPPKTIPSAPINMMQQVLEGNIEFSLLNTDEYIEGYVVGVDPMIMGQLRAGELSPEAHIDLHGQNLQQAYSSLTVFLKNAYQRGLRTVLVITGRGKNSPFGIGVIRNSLQEWLTKNPFKRVVIGFCTAQPHDGGAGAVYVMLRKYKKSHGKIIWDIPFHGADEI